MTCPNLNEIWTLSRSVELRQSFCHYQAQMDDIDEDSDDEMMKMKKLREQREEKEERR